MGLRAVCERYSADSQAAGSLSALFSLRSGQRRNPVKKEIPYGQLLKEKQAKANPLLLKIFSKVKLMKIFFAKSDRLKAPSPFYVVKQEAGDLFFIF